MGKLTGTALCCLCLAALAGCHRYTDIRAGILATKGDSDRLEKINQRYKVGPPDELQVEVRDNRDLGVKVTIRPDGYITLPLLRDVYVADMTPVQISDMLDKEFTHYLKEVQTTVTVTGFNSKKVYVFGEVMRPGPQQFSGDMTVVEAIARAGSITLRAATGSVRLVRPDPEGGEKVFKIDLDDITIKGQSLANLQMNEGDIVFVPSTVLAKVGYAIDSVMWPFRGLLTPLSGYSAIKSLSSSDD
ncbi:MAG TPA: polysaccharide biosynthesis/export family protein [Planctomycetota bacterium]|nr:polysaccharide biosynthesis/export family protein [Planctomycetota bacterium]